MPNIANLDIDPLAFIALGFLGAVIVLTFGLFWWIMSQGGKKRG